MKHLTLDQLKPGTQAVVTRLNANGTERRRLMDLGILPGTHVGAEFRGPLGDPTAYRVRGALIALRGAQARMVDIELIGGAAS